MLISFYLPFPIISFLPSITGRQSSTSPIALSLARPPAVYRGRPSTSLLRHMARRPWRARRLRRAEGAPLWRDAQQPHRPELDGREDAETPCDPAASSDVRSPLRRPPRPRRPHQTRGGHRGEAKGGRHPSDARVEAWSYVLLNPLGGCHGTSGTAAGVRPCRSKF